MKSRLTYLIALVLTMACTAEQNDGEQPAEGTPIGFTGRLSETLTRSAATAEASGAGSAPAATTTRAGEEYTGGGAWTTETLRGVGFGVYCWYTGSSDFTTAAESRYMLMRNQKVEYDDGWTYAPRKYWPLEAGEKLTFRAYAPYDTYVMHDASGLPRLPVVVHSDDYCKDRQQDPLWGTSDYVGGTHSPDEQKRYGEHYDNFTYRMSGSELTTDSRDGIIDWYFHHGMAMFALQAQLGSKPATGKGIRLTKIHTGPFYDQGLLDIFTSPTATAAEKPVWHERSGNINVELEYQHDPGSTGNPHHDLTGIALNDGTYSNVALNGLLVIPRDYSGENTKMVLRVTYEEYDLEDGTVTSEKTTEAKIDLNVQGNTVYWLQLFLNAEENTLYIRSFINLDWQKGAYGSFECDQ